MAGANKPSDFASAAMMRLVAVGLARQGLGVAMRQPSGAHVPRMEKRGILEDVLLAHGPLAILKISDAAKSMPPEPVAQALTRARSIGELLERWHRMERFSHGRHTVQFDRIGEDAFTLSHRTRDTGPPPSPAESLVVLGLLAMLAEIIGSEDVLLSTESGEVWRQAGMWHNPSGSGPPGRMNLSGRATDNRAQPLELSGAGDPSADIRGRVSSDPVRRWSLAELAQETGTSVRTLQRRLSENAKSFSRIVTEARLGVAAEYLCDADGPGLAEIGFLAGFSDQAHFTRSFSREVGTTPGNYRLEFQA